MLCVKGRWDGRVQVQASWGYPRLDASTPDRLLEALFSKGNPGPGAGLVYAAKSQRTQYPLIKEYTFNQNVKAPIISGYILQLRGIGFSGTL